MRKKRVLVVGGGSAGMSCVDRLISNGDEFDVTLIDSVNRCGGQAFSIGIDENRYGCSWLNQGVQGGSPIFHHTFRMFRKQGYQVTPVKLQISFGKDQYFWTNVFPTKLIGKHRDEIKKFHRLLKLMSYLKIFFLLIPIRILLKICLFSNDFINYLILPTVALFLGTGNATPLVPSIILERLLNCPTFGMWHPPDDESLASNLSSMVVFPNLTELYTDWQKDLEKRGVKVRLSTELIEVIRRDKHGVQVKLKSRLSHDTPVKANMSSLDEHTDETIEEFDQMVLTILPDKAKTILGKNARWMERWILGWVKFADDVTVTHTDTNYMEKYYTNHYHSSQAVENLNGRDERGRCLFGKTHFKPMYYIKEYQSNPQKLQMSFDCSNYQSQFPESLHLSSHIFQTIFLNKKDSSIWTKDEISKEKILREDWWHQICHSWTHYLFVVPFIWLISGRNSTIYAGSWTLVNAHEVASISGLAAACRLGADYPEDLLNDGFALLCFRLFLLLSHGKWFSTEKNKTRINDPFEI